MIIAFIAAGAILLILSAGLINYSLRRIAAEKVALPWHNPDNIVDINGVRTHVLTVGQGEPLLLIHGSQMSLYDWRFNIDSFAREFKVYSLDMVGCGYSDKPKADYSPGYYAQFIQNVMDHFGMEKASIVASSWGGGHALHFALAHPEKVNRLVLSSPCGLPHSMNFMDSVLAIPGVSSIVMLFITKGIIQNQLTVAFEKKELIDKGLIDSVYYPLLTQGAVRSTVRSYGNADFTFVRDNLDRIGCPVLIFWGTKDRIHARWIVEEMQKRIAGVQVSVVENAGHMPHEEASGEFNRASLEFLLA